MASKRVLTTLGSVSRPAVRRTAPVCARALCVPATRAVASSSSLVRAAVSRAYATHAPSDAPPAGTPAMVGAQLRAAIESELHTLSSALSTPVESEHVHRYLRPLSPEEVELVNMGQVPALPGGEVMALLDLNLAAAPFDREKPTAGPDGKGVHVPLLAMAGSTDPAVPCYPLGGLFEQLAPRVVRSVHGVLGAQRAGKEATDVDADERSPLVALLAPHDGEKRDLGMPLAIAFFRLAMHEGNGHTEDIAQ